jgi:hypothetical protein
MEVEFSGRARLVEQELTAPALFAYRSPADGEGDISVVVQKTSLGETGAVVHNAYKMATILDLSRLEMPPNSQFRYFRASANKEMDMDSFELLGVDLNDRIGQGRLVQPLPAILRNRAFA